MFPRSSSIIAPSGKNRDNRDGVLILLHPLKSPPRCSPYKWHQFITLGWMCKFILIPAMIPQCGLSYVWIYPTLHLHFHDILEDFWKKVANPYNVSFRSEIELLGNPKEIFGWWKHITIPPQFVQLEHEKIFQILLNFCCKYK